jgi:AcrR family transcriptional regulator
MLTIKTPWLDADVNDDDVDDTSISTAMIIFREHGLDELSIRSIAGLAQVPPATIQRRFKTRDGLLQHMFGRFNSSEIAHMRRAEAAALGRMPTMNALADFVCAFTANPARRTERVMLVELLSAAARNPALKPYAAFWVDRTNRFWAQIAPQDAPDELAAFLTELQVGLAVASIGCDALVQVDLANAEIVRLALAGWKDLDVLWFRRLLVKAVQPSGTSPAEDTVDFLAAGAQILATEGAAAVSFRTVAARAGRSFSSAASTFRKKDALIFEIYKYIAERSVTSAPPWIDEPRDDADMAAIIADMLTAQGLFAGTYLFNSTVELSFLAARGAEFSDLAWRMRMTTGLYELRKNDPRFNPVDDRSFLAHARACWANGLGLVHTSTQAADQAKSRILAQLSAGMPRFSVRQG